MERLRAGLFATGMCMLLAGLAVPVLAGVPVRWPGPYAALLGFVLWRVVVGLLHALVEALAGPPKASSRNAP